MKLQVTPTFCVCRPTLPKDLPPPNAVGLGWPFCCLRLPALAAGGPRGTWSLGPKLSRVQEPLPPGERHTHLGGTTLQEGRFH